ncbi:peptidoglycan DD-metalloendopeptidase family protein [Planctobacterium marinum]|uniref:peptidoglycan DD-metalloendopeptidase family protein n=1 Tax=Planctobacterium marinum TaxID=1631968 RepID=UPI0030C748D6
MAKLPSGFDDIPHGEALELSPGTRYVLPIDASILLDSDVSFEEEQEWQTYTVRRGDNLAKIFSRAGLTAKEVYHVSRAGSAAKKLLKIMPGENLEILKSKEGDFKELQYSYSPTEAVRVYKQSDSYKSEVQQKELYTRLNYASGEISSNFWNAGVEAGLSDNLIMSLATVFGWDIDFALDIRKGDNFNVIFEENYIEGEFVGYGDIVAAEFSNQGEEFAAIRYKDGNYYTPEGRSMRKSFLRAPVNFKYISSNFNPRRFHPVQKRYKAHNGIDYAAKTGTPVVAAGDGKVIESSYNRFNGHYVFLQHGDTYTTKYIHFSKRAVKKGQWVKQGQVIGYVGATGLAAGPHLHYEFLVNGVHKNPRTVKLPKALPIKKSEKSEFLELARDYQAKLDNNRRIMLAMN